MVENIDWKFDWKASKDCTVSISTTSEMQKRPDALGEIAVSYWI
jgi:hypothetical protein